MSVTKIPATTNLTTDKVRRNKRIIGVVAISLLIFFTILALPPLNLLSLIDWIIADLAVALIANLLLRRVGRVNL
jgi:hypothetical protein